MTEVGPHMHTDTQRNKNVASDMQNREEPKATWNTSVSNSFHMDASDNMNINDTKQSIFNTIVCNK